MSRAEYWVDEPRYTAHSYYHEWIHDFLLVDNFKGAVITPDAKKRVEEWCRAHCVGRVYIVGNRVSMMSDVDAVAFKITWG